MSSKYSSKKSKSKSKSSLSRSLMISSKHSSSKPAASRRMDKSLMMDLHKGLNFIPMAPGITPRRPTVPHPHIPRSNHSSHQNTQHKHTSHQNTQQKHTSHQNTHHKHHKHHQRHSPAQENTVPNSISKRTTLPPTTVQNTTATKKMDHRRESSLSYVFRERKLSVNSVGTFEDSSVEDSREMLPTGYTGLEAVKQAYMMDKRNHFLKCTMLTMTRLRSSRNTGNPDRMLVFQKQFFEERGIKPTLDDIITLSNLIKKFANQLTLVRSWASRKKVAFFLKWKLSTFGFKKELNKQVKTYFKKSLELGFKKERKGMPSWRFFWKFELVDFLLFCWF